MFAAACGQSSVGFCLRPTFTSRIGPFPATPGDGAILGVLAGIVGAAIEIVIGIPISIPNGEAL